MWLLEKGEGPQGILKRGNKIAFVTCVMCCTSAGLGDANILWHLEMGQIPRSCPEDVVADLK